MKKRSVGLAVFALAALCVLPAADLTQAFADEIVSESNAIVFYSGEGSVSYYIDADFNLYAAGNNGNGELGNGTKGSARYMPSKVMENVATVADGKSGFAVAVTRDGKIYGWGKDQYAQLGQGSEYNADSETNCRPAPVEIGLPAGKVPAAVAAGDSFTVILTEAGEVFTCGRAGDGQTGLPLGSLTRTSVVNHPTAIEQSAFGGEKIVSVDAAENTGFALTESGALYIWGANDKGILGMGSDDEGEIYETPHKLEFEEKIVGVSAETMNVFVLTESGKVYGWGDNSVGQIGNPEDAADAVAPLPVEVSAFYATDGTQEEIEIAAVLCGGRTNFVLSKAGAVYAFGAAGKGEAGFNLRNESALNHPCVKESNVIRPLRVQFYEPVSLENASEEVLATYSDKSPVDFTKPIDVKVAELVNSIGDRTFVRDENGNLWSWGNNLYAMLGSGDALDTASPVRATLFRKENYDKDYETKNYMIKPAVVMSLVVAFAIGYFVYAEIKIRRFQKKLNADPSAKKQPAQTDNVQ